MKGTSNIPQPKTFGPLRNLPLLNGEEPIQSILKLSYEYGPIFQLELPGRTRTIVSNHELAAEVCDESRFEKSVGTALQNVRAFTGDGLFTSWTNEPNWHKAHNILLPSFSQQAMKGYHSMMVDLAMQLVQKWERLNPNESIDVPEDMTRLTLDTIGLCGFNYRFNSFYRDTPHPFITSMVRSLEEAMNQSQRLGIQDKLMVMKKRQFKQDIQSMFDLVDNIIAERKESDNQDGNDLLAHMLNGKDPQTGEMLDDENIRFQIITFLIAGHETTSGLLSFALYFLLKNPDKLKKAYEEVDRVLTEPIPTYEQVQKLKYTRMILNETLRLWPTAPAISLYAKEATLLGGKYHIEKGREVTVLIPKLHRDTDVWGDAVEDFQPERFESIAQIATHAYKPFGNGQRACIGQQFALQEATLVLGMILQYFEIIDHTDYQLKVKETLTLKPDGFTMCVKPRTKKVTFAVSDSKVTVPTEQEVKHNFKTVVDSHHTPLLVLYGSNLGTAEGLARKLADTARFQGFESEVAPLDEYTEKLPRDGVVCIITSSYNGNPPDNAKEFVHWISELEDETLKGVNYAVFGCGDRNWASTYQRIPRLIDEQLALKGATRLTIRGEGDVNEDFEFQFDEWQNQLWEDVAKALNLEVNKNEKRSENKLKLQFVSELTSTPLAKTYNALSAYVIENRELQTEKSVHSTRHIEITLPEGIQYREGDHLGVLPQNRKDLVERVLQRYGLNGKDVLLLSGNDHSIAHLPLEQSICVYELLANYVELQEPVTRTQLRELAAYTVCPPHKRELEALLEEEAYKTNILQKRTTMLDLLEKYPACELPFERFLELLPPLKVRYYSISSSPQIVSNRASITVGVVRGPSWSGRGEYLGVASNYLAERQVGDAIACFIRNPQSGFHLPENPEKPIIMVGPGTGVAPFLGFLQARRVQKQEGHKLGEAHLYFGCRHPEQDYLYREELERAQEDGLVMLHTAFSRLEGQSKTYVQHLMKQDANELIRLLDEGGQLYVCGDGSRMAPDVERVLCENYQIHHGVDEQKAKDWLDHLQSEGRYAKDVWAGI
ncbi:Bifunctional cytochrome P450/NADPH--P450 reductase [Bacillus rhizoplanae]|uniref:Bifunctional cytochrome P450/NADPH--P450 reductase n=1 Tax=Bacillus rhizoplanae TaxID=2880966 RepID=A0ABN7ZZW2_9BACI|nr:bifunctional cytochrome P450/NADPH--P450 reductase [Bacillus rhizoplanae]CAG9612201.1 Bifunctional cytochrome P450/NADPH--P450 reductase [Bacillus rhizoplanae]